MFLPGSTLLFPRDQCPSSDYQTCGQGLPSNFCCPTNTVCLVLASNTTAICCPEGQSCSEILPITCDIQAQNATAHSDSPILTTALGADLSQCGSQCCPFGYECEETDGDAECVMAEDQAAYSSLLPQTAQAVATKTSTSTSTFKPTPTSISTTTATTRMSLPSVTMTTTPVANTTTTISAQQGAGRSGIIAGSVVGLAILITGVAIIGWTKRKQFFNYLRRKRSRPFQPQYTPFPHQPPSPPPPGYLISKNDQGHMIRPPVWGRRAEMAARTKTPRLTLGPFGNNPPYFTKSSAFQVPPYTPSAELHATAAHQEFALVTHELPPPIKQDAMSPVELPASPLSFSLWERQRNSSRIATTLVSVPPPATYLPLSRFSFKRRPGLPDDRDNFF